MRFCGGLQRVALFGDIVAFLRDLCQFRFVGVEVGVLLFDGVFQGAQELHGRGNAVVDLLGFGDRRGLGLGKRRDGKKQQSRNQESDHVVTSIVEEFAYGH